MKTNRILYPNGLRCSAQDHAAILPYHLVTVGGHEYWIHRYEGDLNGIGKAIVLLSYPKDAFGNKNALRVFICSDLYISDADILAHYTHRRKIEVMFKQQKCIWGSNPSRSVPQWQLTGYLASCPWHISSLWPFLMPCCFCPLPSVVLGLFCAVFDFAHLESAEKEVEFCVYCQIFELALST